MPRLREGGRGAEPDHLAYMNWITGTIGEHGWAVPGVEGDGAVPPWAYSVGMWLTCQTPELVVCGAPVRNAAGIVNAIGARIADGAEFGPDDVLDDVCPARLILRPVDLSWRATTGLLTVSDTFYGMVRPPYLQVVWPDRHDTLPVGTGLPGRVSTGSSRCSGSPATTTRPSPWTRLDQP